MANEKTPKTEDITFKDLNLSRNITQHLESVGFTVPSEIQAKAIPIILEKSKDIVGIAQTGTGKTAAFALPIIDMLSTEKDRGRTPQAIILAPTRELALQVTKEISKFSSYKKLEVMTVYGGAPIQKQIQTLKRGVDIVVGTPGRVVDLLQRNALDISTCFHFILDEADEMLKMGFIEDLEFVMQHIPQKRRVYLFSATMPDRIKSLSKTYMKKQVVIEIEKKVEINNLITQEYFFVDRGKKFDVLIQTLQMLNNDFHAIIFCRTKADVDNITTLLKNQRYKADCIHGDIAQNKREKILQDFKSKRVDILVATDVAARGIHVDNLSHVINYSLPDDNETYTHRVGRTGRAGNSGNAISLVTKSEIRKLRDIEREFKIKITERKPATSEELLEFKEKQISEEISTLISRVSKLDKNEASKLDDVVMRLTDDFSPEDIIKALLHQKMPKEREVKAAKVKLGAKGDVRLFIAKGKIDKMHKKSLLTYLENESGVNLKSASDVKVCEKFSFVSINAKTAQELVDHFTKNKKGRRPMVEFASN